jgi:hypothetical protein
MYNQGGWGRHDDSFGYATIDGADNGGVVRDYYFWPDVVKNKQQDFWKKGAMGGTCVECVRHFQLSGRCCFRFQSSWHGLSVVAKQVDPVASFCHTTGEVRSDVAWQIFEPGYPGGSFERQDFMRCVEVTHATWMFHHPAFKVRLLERSFDCVFHNVLVHCLFR